VPVAANQDRSPGGSERDEVVVSGIARMDRRLFIRVIDERRRSGDPVDEGMSILLRDPATELWIGKCSFEFFDKEGGDDQVELAALPGAQDVGGAAGRREERGDQDVRVENRLHEPSARLVTCPMLRLDGERGRIVFGEVVFRPEPRK
jgi:hypothetical protein